jgi:PAS domain S-box-containing protein
MTIPEDSSPGIYNLHFTHLPGFATFLLENKLDVLVHDGLHLAHELHYPLLKYFEHMPEEQLIAISKISNTELLTHIINNTLDKQIQTALNQWLKNQLPVISKEQVVVKDITMGGYLRKKIWMKLLLDYTDDIKLAFAILDELEIYQTRNNDIFLQVYIDMQHERIEEMNKGLLHNEELYKQAQELTHIGNWSWAIADNKMTWSDEMYRIFGMEPQSEEMTVDKYISMIHPDDRQIRYEQMHASLRTLKPPAYTVQIRRADGGIAVIGGKNEVLTNAADQPYKMLGTCQDITTEYYLNQALEQTNGELQGLNLSLEHKNRELERSNQELTSFSYIASHDLQEPLRKIKTYSNLIADTEAEKLSDKGRQFFANINASATRMQQLIQDLLAFSHTHTTSIEKQEIDLNLTIKEVIAHYDDQIKEQQLIIKVGDLPMIKGIPFQFTQLFQNIISNAIKYKKQSEIPEIIITSELVDGETLNIPDIDKKLKYHKIDISDNGIGFEQQYGDRIFEIFQRLHNRDEYSGTGVGLAICKKIVQNHDGHIYASSTPGVGSVFSVCLPQSLN